MGRGTRSPFLYKTLQYAALTRGAAWAEAAGHGQRARSLAEGADALASSLAEHWSPTDHRYRSRMPCPGISVTKELDSVVLLAVLHAGLSNGRFSVFDSKVVSTVTRLEAFFSEYLPLNAGRRPADSVALGRYEGDHYFEGGAFVIACFGWQSSTTAGPRGMTVPMRTLPWPGATPCSRSFGRSFRIRACCPSNSTV